MSMHQSLGEALKDPGLGPDFVRLTRALREKRFPRGSRQVHEVEIDGRWRFKVDVGDRLGADVFFGNYGEMLDVEAFCRTLQPGDNVIDVGANFGFVSILAASYLGTRGRVVAFEPDEHAYGLLAANVKLNRLSRRITTLKRCAGDRDGNVSFYRAQESAFSGMADTGRSKVEVVEMVPVQRLDQAVDELRIRQVHALKIDVEGFEYAVLNGAKSLLARSEDPLVMFEVSPKNLEEGRRALLEASLETLRVAGWEVWCYAPDRDEFVSAGSLGELLELSTGNAYLARAKSKRLDKLRAAYRNIVDTRLLPMALRQSSGGLVREGGAVPGPHSMHRLLWNSFLNEWGGRSQADLARVRLEIAQAEGRVDELRQNAKLEATSRVELQGHLEKSLAEGVRLVERIRQLEAEVSSLRSEFAATNTRIISFEEAAVQAQIREALLTQEREQLRQLQQSLTTAHEAADERARTLEQRVAQAEAEAATQSNIAQAALTTKDAEASRYRTKAEQQAAELAGAAQRLEVQRTNLEQQRVRLEQQQRDLESQRSRADQQEGALGQQRARTEQLESELKTQQAVIEQERLARTQLQVEAEARQRWVEAQEGLLAQQRVRSEQLEGELRTLQAALGEERTGRDSLARELAQERQAHAHHLRELEAVQNRAKEHESLLDQQRTRGAHLEAELSTLQGVLAQERLDREQRQSGAELEIERREKTISELKSRLDQAESDAQRARAAGLEQNRERESADRAARESLLRTAAELAGLRAQVAQLTEARAASDAECARVRVAASGEVANLQTAHESESTARNAALAEAGRTTIRLTTELAEARSLAAQREETVTALRQEIGRMRTQSDAHQAEGRRVAGLLEQAAQDLAARQSTLAQREAELDAAGKALAAARDELTRRATELAVTRTELKDRTAETNQLDLKWTLAARELEGSRVALGQSETRLAAARVDLATQHAAFAATRADLDLRETELVAARAELEQRGASLAELTGLWTASQQELTDRGRALEELNALWQEANSQARRNHQIAEEAETRLVQANSRISELEVAVAIARRELEATVSRRLQRLYGRIAGGNT